MATVEIDDVIDRIVRDHHTLAPQPERLYERAADSPCRRHATSPAGSCGRPASSPTMIGKSWTGCAALCSDLGTIRGLASGFTDLVRTRGGARLEAWVKQAEQGSIPEIRSFANGLRKDCAAVTAGLTLAWSSAPVEGAVNRIKMIKRELYGRVNPDLLRRRILLGD